jgi:hypothetical protein
MLEACMWPDASVRFCKLCSCRESQPCLAEARETVKVPKVMDSNPSLQVYALLAQIHESDSRISVRGQTLEQYSLPPFLDRCAEKNNKIASIFSNPHAVYAMLISFWLG